MPWKPSSRRMKRVSTPISASRVYTAVPSSSFDTRATTATRAPAATAAAAVLTTSPDTANEHSTPGAIGPCVLISISGSPSSTTSTLARGTFTSRVPIHRSGG